MENKNLEQLIKLLEENIKTLKETEITTEYDKYKNIEEKLENNLYEILNHTDLLINIKLEENEKYTNLIQTLNILRNNDLIQLTDEQIKIIKQNEIYMKCKNKILNYKNKIQQIHLKEQQKENINKELKNIIETLKNLNNKIIEDETIKQIYSLILNDNISKQNEIIDLILKYNIEIYEQQKTNYNRKAKEILTDEELEEIFKKYGYNYNLVSDDFKQRLKTKGNLINIEEVFEAIKKYNLKFNEKNPLSICLLIKSDKEIIDNIWNISKKYNFDFYDIIKKIPSCLLHKNNNRIRLEKNNTQSETLYEISGSYEDLEKNIKIIEEVGYNIQDVFKNTISILIIPHEKIKRNIEALHKYGFPKNLKSINFSLTGLKSDNITASLDMFIELNEFEYIKNNTSRLTYETDAYIFKRLYFAKKYNKQNTKQYKIKRKYDNKDVLTGIISNENDTTLNSIIDTQQIENTIIDKETDKILKDYIEQNEKKGYEYRTSNDELIINIEKNYLDTNITYRFNETIISRYKTHRIYTLLKDKFTEIDKKDLLLYALTYNSIIDHEELNYIKSCINKEKTK